MANDPADARPFAIQLEVEFLDRLSEPVRDGKAKSVSEIIRAALARFDLTQVVVVRPPQVMISVRLPAAVREELQATAKAKHTSVGQLVRSAVEAYLPQLEAGDAGQLEMAIPHVELPEEEPAPAGQPEASPRASRPAAKKKSSRKTTAPRSKNAKGARKKPVPAAKRATRKSAPQRARKR